MLQGLGGLGKSTLAQRVLPWLTDDEANVCTLWCQEIESKQNRAEALVGQLLDYCRKRFGLDWEGIVQQVDQAAGDDSAKRFIYFLQTLVQNAPGLILYLDNLESLLIGPKDDAYSSTFGQWAEPALATIWKTIDQMARDTKKFYVIASCRYRNDDFLNALLQVTPLPVDALFRLTEWFPSLQKLSTTTRARLVSRLDGHPRAVEYANDLVKNALTNWRNAHGEWTLSLPPSPEEVDKEWKDIVQPCLPQVAEKLKDNLLLQELWDRVLDDKARRFLCRMTVLRQPVEWDLLQFLGEPDEPTGRALETAERLRDTSLLEQMEIRILVSKDRIGTSTHYTLNSATNSFINKAHGDTPEIRTQTHHRLGEHLEAEAKDSLNINTHIEAGHHLFKAGKYDRAFEILGSASTWLQQQGRVREGLRILEPFLEKSVQIQMDRTLIHQLFGTVGTSHHRLSEVQKAIEYYEQRLSIAREIGDRYGQGIALGNLGIAYKDLGKIQKAIGYYEQRLAIAHELGDRHGEGKVLGNLGNAYSHLGKSQKAIEYFEKILIVFRELGDRRGEGATLGNLGRTYLSLGESQKAIEHFEQHIVIAREIGDRRGESAGLGNLGNAYSILGEVQKAISFLKQAKAIGEQISQPEIVKKATRALEQLSERQG